MARLMLVLGIDTCGPTGSVALGQLAGPALEHLGQTELAGRSYSATLVAAVAELLSRMGFQLKDVGAIVIVNGPGSFTGVRVGLSAVKVWPNHLPFRCWRSRGLRCLRTSAGCRLRPWMLIGMRFFCGWAKKLGKLGKSWREHWSLPLSIAHRRGSPFVTIQLRCC